MRERVIKQSEHTIYGSLAKFQEANGHHPPGVLTVMNGGLPIDVRHEPAGHDVTTVFFHAALSKTAYRFPIFTGAGISEGLPTNRIYISDPTLYLDDELTLAWYAGNRKQPRLQWVIRAILKGLIPEGQRVVTFGPSGGGFAAMYYATKFEHATAVPTNPQTSLARYLRYEVEKYLRLAWGVEGQGALAQIDPVTELARVYRSGKTRVFYVQNRNDASHIAQHYEPFMAGLPAGHDVHPVLVDGKPGHRPPDKAITRAVLAAAIAGAETPPAAP